MNNFHVFGIGNALMDIQAFIDENFLLKLHIPKGVMHLIDEEKSRKILEELASYKTISLPGGSCANTTSTIAKLGGNPVFTGIVSDDIYGRLYNSKIIQRGVKSLIKFRNNGLTGTSIILTTDDAERTMNTHLGVCRDISKDDIDFNLMSKCKILHLAGYVWDTPQQKEVVEYVMKSAKEMGLKITFDIADPFCIERNKNDFIRIIKEYVNILFGNKDEAKILTDKDDPVEAGKIIKDMGVDVAIVKVGKEGSYLFYNNKHEKIDIYKPEKVMDSTGCGDTYAGGFLYGLINNYDYVKCAKIASYYASRVVSVPGVQLELLDHKQIKKFINDNILKN
ncbi:MAG: adenosine kinase [Spirochaetes bacterium]|nr:adenosine kinase [Spirochaetota bacterium]